MPAGLPGSTPAQNLANPSLGRQINFDPLSGPKGSPLDRGSAETASTGCLSTGIGYGCGRVISISPPATTAPVAIRTSGGVDDDQVAGSTPIGSGTQNVVNSKYMYIGGGRSITSGTPNYSNPAGVAGTNPYTVGVDICNAGNGGSRDGGAGPAFTGFAERMVTAVGTVTNGSTIESTFTNRTGVTMVAGQSAFGSAQTQLAAAS